MFDKRSSGDYEDFFNHTQKSAEALYPDAKCFVEKIKVLVNDWLDRNSTE